MFLPRFMTTKAHWILIICLCTGAPTLVAPAALAQPNGLLELSLENAVGAVGTEVEVRIDFQHPLDTVEGIAVGVCHDPAAVELLEVTTDQPYDFFSDLNSDGFVFTTILGFGAHYLGEPLIPGSSLGIVVARYRVLTPGVTTLQFCDTQQLFGITQNTVIVILGASHTPTQIDGSIASETSFRRGDINSDGQIDLADAIFLEQYLFAGGPIPSCLSACDTNHDGLIDIADSIRLLMYLFVGAPPPDAPFATCGVEFDDISCQESLCP